MKIYRAARPSVLFRVFVLNLVATIFICYLEIDVARRTGGEASDQTVMDLRPLYLIGSDWFP